MPLWCCLRLSRFNRSIHPLGVELGSLKRWYRWFVVGSGRSIYTSFTTTCRMSHLKRHYQHYQKGALSSSSAKDLFDGGLY